MPSWLLLFWSGLAAALASEWLAATLRPPRLTRRRGQSVSPTLMRGPRENVIIAIVTGTLLLAPLYGVAFELLHRAEFVNGAVLGTLHGVFAAIVALVAARRPARAGAATPPSVRAAAVYRARRILTRAVYGAVLGFLYVVPPA